MNKLKLILVFFFIFIQSALADGSFIGTSDNTYPLGSTQQDHVFFKDGYWYVFYNDQHQIKYAVSKDGVNFVTRTLKTPDRVGLTFDTKMMDDKVYFAWNDQFHRRLYFTRGTVRDGIIKNCKTSRVLKTKKDFSFEKPYLAFDSSGKPWIVVRYFDFMDKDDIHRFRIYVTHNLYFNIWSRPKDITFDVMETSFTTSGIIYYSQGSMNVIYGGTKYLYISSQKDGWQTKILSDYGGVHDFCIIMGEDGYPKILYRDGEYRLVFLAQGKDGWAEKEVVNDIVSSHSLSFSRRGSEYYAFYNIGDKFIRFRKRSSNGWSDEEVFAKAKELPYGLLYWTSSNRNSKGEVGVAWDEGRAESWVLKFKKMDW